MQSRSSWPSVLGVVGLRADQHERGRDVRLGPHQQAAMRDQQAQTTAERGSAKQRARDA
jgi:hypothetical protein